MPGPDHWVPGVGIAALPPSASLFPTSSLPRLSCPMYPLDQDKDVFVTRIETFPEYLIEEQTHSECVSVQTMSQCLYYRDSYNTSSMQHCYYYTTEGTPPSPVCLPVASASLVFYNFVASTSSMAGAIRSLQRYYGSLYRGYDSLDSFTGSYSILSIPKAYYGKEIVKGHFDVYETLNVMGMMFPRDVKDDGSGSLFVKDFIGLTYEKAGNIFYSEGLAFLTYSSIIPDVVSWPYNSCVGGGHQPLTIDVSFTGSNNIYVQNIFCHIKEFQANFSNNESAYGTNGAHEFVKMYTGSQDQTWITSVQLYDKEYKLVGVAKISSPIRKRPSDKLCIKLRNDIL